MSRHLELFGRTRRSHGPTRKRLVDLSPPTNWRIKPRFSNIRFTTPSCHFSEVHGSTSWLGGSVLALSGLSQLAHAVRRAFQLRANVSTFCSQQGGCFTAFISSSESVSAVSSYLPLVARGRSVRLSASVDLSVVQRDIKPNSQKNTWAKQHSVSSLGLECRCAVATTRREKANLKYQNWEVRHRS